MKCGVCRSVRGWSVEWSVECEGVGWSKECGVYGVWSVECGGGVECGV